MSEVSGLTLLIPQKPDVERDAVAREWQRRGGEVLRLDRFWEPPELNPGTVRIYGPDAFATVLAQILGLRLLEPAPDLALSVPRHLLQRDVRVESPGAAMPGRFPIFAKPLVPKLFPGQVYRSPEALRSATAGLDGDERILLSESIQLDADSRPLKSIEIETVNGEPARESPYCAVLGEIFRLTRDVKSVKLWKRY